MMSARKQKNKIILQNKPNIHIPLSRIKCCWTPTDKRCGRKNRHWDCQNLKSPMSSQFHFFHDFDTWKLSAEQAQQRRRRKNIENIIKYNQNDLCFTSHFQWKLIHRSIWLPYKLDFSPYCRHWEMLSTQIKMGITSTYWRSRKFWLLTSIAPQKAHNY